MLPVYCLSWETKVIFVQSNLNSSNTDGLFTSTNSNSFFESRRNSSESSRKQILRDIFLFYHDIVQSNLDGSNTDGSFIMANSNSFFESL